MIAIMLDDLFDAVAREASFPADTAIFRQGERAHSIFRVLDGRVAMVRHLADGGVATLTSAGPNETFAEAALFAEAYHCDAIARSAARVLCLPTKEVHRLLAKEPERALALAAFYARQVRELRQRIELLRIKRATERLYAWLRLRASGDPPRVAPTEPWAAIASEIGLTPEALYRALRSLEGSGKIRRTSDAVLLSG